MIKFDLERAKKGHPVITRDGRKVRIVATDCTGKYPLVCLVMGESGIEVVNTYNVDGTLSDSVDHPADLFMSPKKAKRYFNIYTRKDNGNPVMGECALTLDQSIRWATKSNHNLKFIRREVVEILL